jgi:hypothetical protein
MKKSLLRTLSIIVILFITKAAVFADICEKHTFAEEQAGFAQYFFYSYGRTWDFTAENNLNLNFVTLYVLLAGPGTYQAHIQIKKNDEVVASWDQNITTAYTYYTLTNGISGYLRTGDTISFFIFGGSSSTPGGAVADGDNYLELCGEEWIQPPPTVATGVATNITCSSAMLNATVNPEGNSTNYYFEYGPTTAYGSSTSPVNLGSGNDNVSISQKVTILEHNKTYHYRVVANNDSTMTSFGDDMTFTTQEHCINISIILLLLSD